MAALSQSGLSASPASPTTGIRDEHEPRLRRRQPGALRAGAGLAPCQGLILGREREADENAAACFSPHCLVRASWSIFAEHATAVQRCRASVTGLHLPREVFFGRLGFAGAFVPVCESDFGRFFAATSGSSRLMCSR